MHRVYKPKVASAISIQIQRKFRLIHCCFSICFYLKLTICSCFPVSLVTLIALVIILPHGLHYASSSSVHASATRTFSSEADGDALLAFKASLSIQSGALASWNTTTELCRWQGVTCSLKHKHRVIALNLSSEGLAGTITHSIGNLTFLRILDLSSNNLQGEIPSSVSHLARLRHLNLSYNLLNGQVLTQLKNCTRLEMLQLGSNRLTGQIPSYLGGLPSLKIIHMNKNNFSGVIPESLGNLSSLQEFNFKWNQLEGSIPESIGRLSGLEFVELGENHLSGTIPASLLNISSLTHLSLLVNELHGLLPSGLGNRLSKLQNLYLGMNRFTGSIPASLANATEIQGLDISHNNFTGSLAPEVGKVCPDFLSLEYNQLLATTARDWEFMTFLTNCTRLRIFSIQGNMLSGMLPASVANLSAQLQLLYIGNNEISGNVPSGISNLVSLTQLQLSNNRFTGVLPESIGRLGSLQALGFNSNMLTGFLPSSLGNLTLLLKLYTDNNMLEGSLPASLGNLHNITIALFSNNRFTGPLPIHIFNLSSLSYALDLSDNYFVGTLPPEVGGMTKLAYLYISRNNLSGPLPDALSSCQSLTDLRLDSNSFNSSIPASISKIRGLMILTLANNSLSGAVPHELGLLDGLIGMYLSNNNLSGCIPESFENMTSLDLLDLSFNHFEGEVSLHGVVSNATGFLFDGNAGLCGGIPELHLPQCLTNSVEHRKGKFHPIFKVILPIAGILVCSCLVLMSISLRKKQKHQQSTTLAEFNLMDDRYPRVSYAELVQGTNGFDTNNLIGTGRYGSVYKCSLSLKDTIITVAVKVFDLQQSGSSKSFISECEALGKIRHRNLIGVITCCSSSDSNRNDFKALVLEFMPNGSLHRWIHRDVHASQERPVLTLMQRLNIAVDVVDALEYLHNNCDPPIVHCDLKPSNILLDQDLVAHIGDFGLAKILSDSESEQLVNSKSTIGIRGTIGYVAPEYAEGGQVSPCGDIYSFGIVLLELFTGLVPTHDMFRDGLTLQKHAESMYPGMLMNIVDPFLLSYASNLQGVGNSMEVIDKVMVSIIKLALSCSKQAPAERMCIGDAAAEMHRIRNLHVNRRQMDGEATVN